MNSSRKQRWIGTEDSQLSLFLEDRVSPGKDALGVLQDGNVEEKLHAILQMDLGFKGEVTTYATHNIHAFAAKFPPQLPGVFIKTLTVEGQVVLDPMAGSGTTLLEAMLCGRKGIGFDLDPLAVMISQMKTTPLDTGNVRRVASRVIDWAEEVLSSTSSVIGAHLESRYSEKARAFFEYWFREKTIEELLALIQEIDKVTSPKTQNMLKIIFSSIIVTKSGGVSLARDLAHSRPHKVSSKMTRSALDAFKEKVLKTMSSFDEIKGAPGKALSSQADARSLPLSDSSVDLIVTSPPYANAIDYVRAHKFSLIWLGYEPDSLSQFRREYIGAEIKESNFNVPSKTARDSIQAVQGKDARKAGILAKYFKDMEMAIREMFRVLRCGKGAVIVVGSSTIRGIDVLTHFALAEIAQGIGFSLVGIKAREIDRDKRLLPWSREGKGGGIEARIHQECVIALVKPL